MPWPPPLTGDVLRAVDPATPDLAGPDVVERAPVVQVFSDKIALDGFQCSLDELADKLATILSFFHQLHPGERFNGQILVLAEARLPVGRLLPVLRTFHEGGYANPLFTFTKAEAVDRPVLGRLEHVRSSGARAALIDAYDIEVRRGEENAETGGLPGVRIDVADFSTYDQLARRLVEVRRGGRRAVVNLGK